jgi:hypothetical protein
MVRSSWNYGLEWLHWNSRHSISKRRTAKRIQNSNSQRKLNTLHDVDIVCSKTRVSRTRAAPSRWLCFQIQSIRRRSKLNLGKGRMSLTWNHSGSQVSIRVCHAEEIKDGSILLIKLPVLSTREVLKAVRINVRTASAALWSGSNRIISRSLSGLVDRVEHQPIVFAIQIFGHRIQLPIHADVAKQLVRCGS